MILFLLRFLLILSVLMLNQCPVKISYSTCIVTYAFINIFKINDNLYKYFVKDIV